MFANPRLKREIYATLLEIPSSDKFQTKCAPYERPYADKYLTAYHVAYREKFSKIHVQTSAAQAGTNATPNQSKPPKPATVARNFFHVKTLWPTIRADI
jgi:hypothetical protein